MRKDCYNKGWNVCFHTLERDLAYLLQIIYANSQLELEIPLYTYLSPMECGDYVEEGKVGWRFKVTIRVGVEEACGEQTIIALKSHYITRNCGEGGYSPNTPTRKVTVTTMIFPWLARSDGS
jgi:hypothetical protein